MDEPYATRREFDDFRQETRDELKWLKRGVVIILIAAVGGPLVSSIIAALIRTPPL